MLFLPLSPRGLYEALFIMVVVVGPGIGAGGGGVCGGGHRGRRRLMVGAGADRRPISDFGAYQSQGAMVPSKAQAQLCLESRSPSSAL